VESISSVVVIGVGHVELEHREFGIVDRRDALVPEVPVDFEHPREAADDEPLQIQFRRDAQIEIDAQRVVVGDEGLRGGAPRDGVHHRRLDLQKPAFDQKGPDAGDDAAARRKNVVHVRIGDQVHVPLAIPCLDVGQPVPLFRQGAERLAQKRQLVHLDGEFVRLGSEKNARHADPIAEIELFRDGIGLLGQQIFFEIHLQPVGPVLQHGEGRLAEAAQGDDAPGERTGNPLLLQDLLGFFSVELDQLAGPILDLESGAVGRHAGLAQLVQLLDPLLSLFVQFIHGGLSGLSSLSGLSGLSGLSRQTCLSVHRVFARERPDRPSTR
jgi:hypothetical protein